MGTIVARNDRSALPDVYDRCGRRSLDVPRCRSSVRSMPGHLLPTRTTVPINARSTFLDVNDGSGLRSLNIPRRQRRFRPMLAQHSSTSTERSHQPSLDIPRYWPNVPTNGHSTFFDVGERSRERSLNVRRCRRTFRPTLTQRPPMSTERSHQSSFNIPRRRPNVPTNARSRSSKATERSTLFGVNERPVYARSALLNVNKDRQSSHVQ
jgi:hypothetical protein